MTEPLSTDPKTLDKPTETIEPDRDTSTCDKMDKLLLKAIETSLARKNQLNLGFGTNDFHRFYVKESRIILGLEKNKATLSVLLRNIPFSYADENKTYELSLTIPIDEEKDTVQTIWDRVEKCDKTTLLQQFYDHTMLRDYRSRWMPFEFDQLYFNNGFFYIAIGKVVAMFNADGKHEWYDRLRACHDDHSYCTIQGRVCIDGSDLFEFCWLRLLVGNANICYFS